MGILTKVEVGTFLKLFNRGGYVLDFSTNDFDVFTMGSIGVALCDKYKMSKGKSLSAYVNEASEEDVIKLLKDLLDYYEENYEKEYTQETDEETYGYFGYNAEYARLYNKCRAYMDRVLNVTTPLATNATELQEKFSSDYLSKQIELMLRMQNENPTDAIGKAKELIESCCKTILDNKGVAWDKNWDRETILSHFEKEEKLFDKGIKCLSLFFIDEVAKYRQYDENGDEVIGEYGKMFEQEYINVLNEYVTLLDTPYQRYLKSTCSDVEEVHKGYFSIDKKGHAIDSKVKRGSEFSDDISAYDLILKNKERLLSFDEPTRFIFSHSALREGWDNPNVFQICTLKHSDSNTAKRQEVGRGLRLCVNQNGNRMDVESCGETVHDINVLTVAASESYHDVDSYQSLLNIMNSI